MNINKVPWLHLDVRSLDIGTDKSRKGDTEIGPSNILKRYGDVTFNVIIALRSIQQWY